MKRCPTCKKTFTDRNLSFCIDDGTPLLPVEELPESPDDEQTVVTPSAGSPSYSSTTPAPEYQAPGSYAPPGMPPTQNGKRRAWPWVIGIIVLLLLALAGLGIAAATFIPSILRATQENNANVNANVNSNDSIETSANSNAEQFQSNTNDWNGVETAPPTSETDVLSVLTDLEHEWTVANINADKKKLNRILADDYVGTTFDGKSQGKADYLRTIERDTAIQRWEFEDLKVSLLGDRATLTGVLRLEVQNQRGEIGPVAFRFADKFVWRNNRWQAVGSEVKQEQ
ncbi:MAG TPA: nuclear transport factor 2 family protein [Pyrinomonadaceae bacterium]|nr:nuclear transport factor 2 family protein [Pyrinomonadaceae bacterium]